MIQSDRRKTVAIVGGTLWGNRGAEAMLVTTIGRIRERYPDARCLVFSYYPEKDRQLCTDSRVEFFNYRPLNIGLKIFPLSLLAWLCGLIGVHLPRWVVGPELDALRQADLLCDIGGITFCDGREIFLLYNVLSILPAMLTGVPVVKLSQAMGPFQGRRNRFFAQRILPHCKHVFSRGDTTSTYLRTLKLDDQTWSAAADVAFGYEPRFSLTSENDDRIQHLWQSVNEHADRETIAIIPSSLVMKKNSGYVSQLSRLVLDLTSANYQVLLLPNATREASDKSRNNDLIPIQAVVDQLRQEQPECLDQVFFVDFDVNTKGIRQLMSAASVVVTSRFHGMVAALADAIPVLVIGWSHKYAEVLAQFESADLCCDHNKTDTRLTDVVIRMLVNQVALREKLQSKLPIVTQSSRQQLEFVCRLLAGTPSIPVDAKAVAQSSEQEPARVRSKSLADVH